MPLPELFANVPNVGQQGPQQLCVLAQDITTTPPAGTVETWNVSAAAPSALRGAGQFRVIINNEVMIVSAPSAGGTAWQWTRGAEGTTVATHSNGASVYHFVTAGAMQTLMQKPTGFFTPEQFGAKGDGVILEKATMAAGSNLLNVADIAASGGAFPGFTNNDVGKVILVTSVGANYNDMVGTIQQINSSTQAQLSFTAVNASPDVNGIGVAVYGTDDTSAIQQGSDAAANSNFGVLQFDNKIYICNGGLVRGGARYSNSQITLPYGGYRIGIGRITWRGVSDSSGTPNMPFPSPGGAVLVSTLIGQDYHTYIQPPQNVQAVLWDGGSPNPPAGTYYYTITAFTTSGETIGSAEVSVTPNGTQQPHITWTQIPGASGYNVYRSTTPGGETTGSTRVASMSGYGNNAFTDNNLTPTANSAPTVNTASYGLPSFIGGPTQELSNSFNGWLFVMEDMTVLCSRNPSISGINLERVSGQNRRRVTVGTLELGYAAPSFVAQPQCLPNKPWAAAMVDPITGNQQGATGANEYVVSWGFFAGHTPTEHTHSTDMRFHTTKIPIAMRQKYVHPARYDYISSETNPYFISGWDPTAVVIPPPAAPVPTTNAAGGSLAAGVYLVVVSYVNAAGGEVVSAQASITTVGAPLAAPAAPVPTPAATGGTIAAGTYTVAVTYVNANGETVASATGTVTTTGTASTITIPSPLASGSATGWYAYVSQAGVSSPLYRQQAAGSPTAIGTALTLTAPPTTTGANPPATNTTASTITIPSPPASNTATGWYAYVSQVGGTSLTRQQPAGTPTAIGTAYTLTSPPTNTGAAQPNYNSTGEKAAIVPVPSAVGDPQCNAVFISQADFEDYSDTSVNWSWATLVNHVNDPNNQLRGRINWTRWSWVNGSFLYRSGIVKNGGISVWTRSAAETPDNVIIGRGSLSAAANTTGLTLSTVNVWTPVNVSNLNATFVVPNNGWVIIEADIFFALSGTTAYVAYLGCVDTSNNYVPYTGGLVTTNNTMVGAGIRYRYRKYVYGLNAGQVYTWRLAVMITTAGSVLTHYYGGNTLSGNNANPIGDTIFEIRGLADDSFFD